MTQTPLSRLELGGIRYHLLGRADWRLSFRESPFSATFGGTNLAVDHEVEVELAAGTLPVPDNTEPVFDTGVAWRLRKGAGTYVVALRADGREPADALVFDREVTRAALLAEPSADGLVLNPFCYPVDQILSMFALAPRLGIILHAAGAVRDGKVSAFAARSGGGKSTLANLIDGKDGWRVIADDRLILRWMDGTWLAHGTPWPGESGIARAEAAPLGGVHVLRRAGEHRAEPMEKADALRALLPVTSVPWFDPDVFHGVLDTVGHLVTDVAAMNLYFRPDAGVLEAIRGAP